MLIVRPSATGGAARAAAVSWRCGVSPLRTRGGARPASLTRPRAGDGGPGGRAPRRAAGLAPPRAEADYQPPSRLGATIGLGLAMQINAALFAAAYQTLPTLQILAARVEEVQPRWAHACMVKLGTLLASPIDLLLLTIALTLIELMRLLAGDDD